MFFEGLVISAAPLWLISEMTVKVKGIVPSNFSRRVSMTVNMRTVVCGVQWSLVLPVDINGLQQPKRHPGPQEEDVVAEDHNSNKETSTEDDGLSWVGVFCLHAKWSLEEERTHCDEECVRVCECVSVCLLTVNSWWTLWMYL